MSSWDFSSPAFPFVLSLTVGSYNAALGAGSIAKGKRTSSEMKVRKMKVSLSFVEWGNNSQCAQLARQDSKEKVLTLGCTCGLDEMAN